MPRDWAKKERKGQPREIVREKKHKSKKKESTRSGFNGEHGRNSRAVGRVRNPERKNRFRSAVGYIEAFPKIRGTPKNTQHSNILPRSVY